MYHYVLYIYSVFVNTYHIMWICLCILKLRLLTLGTLFGLHMWLCPLFELTNFLQVGDFLARHLIEGDLYVTHGISEIARN